MAAAISDVTPAITTFVVERIVVEGARRGAQAIVAAETLLKLGNAYTEPQLREALQRVERLPFVVTADFSLRRGSQRGRYELVITLAETKVIFGGGDLTVGIDDRGGRGGVDWGVGVVPELGARVFFGGQNELAATVGGLAFASDDSRDAHSSFKISYAHHNLFGRHLVGSLSAVSTGTALEYRSLSGSLALPLSRTSALVASVSTSRSSGPELGTWRAAYKDASLAWQTDTTDDPFSPRTGWNLSVAVSRDWSHFERPTFHATYAPIEPENGRVRDEGARVSGSIAGSWFHPLASRVSIGWRTSLRSTRGRTEETLTAPDVSIRGTGYFRSARGRVDAVLLGVGRPRSERSSRWWWEMAASLTGDWNRSDNPLSSATYRRRYAAAGLTVSVATRGRWGTARFAVSYWRTLSSHSESQ